MEKFVKAMPKRRLTAVLLAGLLLVAAAAACGSEDATSPSGDATTDELSGTIEIDGSSTVFPVTAAVAEEFRKEHGGVNDQRRILRDRRWLQALHRRRNCDSATPQGPSRSRRLRRQMKTASSTSS